MKVCLFSAFLVIGSVAFAAGSPDSGLVDAEARWNAKRGYWEPNDDESKVAPYVLEDPCTFADGTPLASPADWPRRRAEILGIFAREMFGQPPPPPEHIVCDLVNEKTTAAGFATRRLFRMYFRPDRTGPCIEWALWLPRHARGRVPVILFLNYRGNHELVRDDDIPVSRGWQRNRSKYGITEHRSSEKTRGLLCNPNEDTVFPLETILARGYAVMSACYGDVSPDPDSRGRDGVDQYAFATTNGVFTLWGARDESRTDNVTSIGAWAWALSRGLDLALRQKEIDSERTVVTGCSRLGKAALLAAARDERFAACVPIQCGGGGVCLAKRDFGENVSTEVKNFTHWYCKAYAKYAPDPAKLLAFDQHLLVASIAPRRVLVEGYGPVNWMDTRGEYLACAAASAAWTFLGLPALPKVGYPDYYDTSAIGTHLGYVRRTEEHGISGCDWNWLLDFADGHGAAKGPDGTEWQDPSRLSLGKEPVSTLTAPKDALDLSGVAAWRFNWARRPSERPVGFERPAYDVSSWPLVTVPCSWQAEGIRPSGERFGVPIYVNMAYTFAPRGNACTSCPPHVVGNDLPKDWTLGSDDNPVGSYRRDFTVPADWLEDEVFIRFEGVESFYYLWINGHYVGFAKDSRSPSVYNVTHYLKPGVNTVAAEVYRYCDGSYLEAQDTFRLSGILRPVRVYRLKKGHLKDVRFEAHPAVKGDYAGDWILTFAADRAAAFKVFSPAGEEVALEDASGALGDRPRPGTRCYRVKSPKLWSAEEPNLYKLVCEDRAFNLGFREIEITEPADKRDRMFLLNGKPIKLNGVNRAEVDPTYGHHCPTARLRQDLALIKKANLNHIRNSHCPQPDEFYDLCDEVGIYVMDEANLESHPMGYKLAGSLGSRPEWLAAHLAREEAMVNRNRNHPCIIQWSLGNEAGTGDIFKSCYEWIKKADPTRPVNYERDCDCADFGSRQYPSLPWMHATAAGRESVKYPFHINEYLHNLNNGSGGHKHFQEVIESSDRIMGGCLWDFADQSLWSVDKATGRRFLAFGGDFGEKPTEGQGMLDGIVGADRTPEPVWHEARHVYQPFEAKLSADGKSVVLESKYFFRDSSAYDFCVNGRVVDLKPLAPREKRVLPLSILTSQHLSTSTSQTLNTSNPQTLNTSTPQTLLNLSFRLREAEGFWEKGWVIASDQIRLPGAPATKALAPAAGEVRESRTAGRLVLSAGVWAYGFDLKTGSLVSICREGEELLRQPVFVDAFRGPVGGEMSVSIDDSWMMNRKWGLQGLRELKPRLKTFTEVSLRDGAKRFATLVDWRGTRRERILRTGRSNPAIEDDGEVDGDAPGYHVATEWKVRPDGTLAVSAAFRQFGVPTEVSRIGYRFVFRTPQTHVTYRALGPWDNYADRCSAAFFGDYAADLSEFVVHYGRTSDCGNRMEAHAVRLEALGLTFAAVGKPLAAFQVSPYSPTDLYLNPHVELLPAPDRTELGLYAAEAGLGSRNCGPLTESEYRIDPKRIHSCSFVLTADPDLSLRELPAVSAPERLVREEPKEVSLFPHDEKTIFDGLAELVTYQMHFCTETQLWKYDGTFEDIPVDWLVVKPKVRTGACPVVLFLNDVGNQAYLDDLSVPVSYSPKADDVRLFAIEGRASELSRGLYAHPSGENYFPLRELVAQGCAVVMACVTDVTLSPKVTEADRQWLLRRGRELIAREPDLDVNQIRIMK